MLNTPILFLVFNRPETTQRVFDAIKLAQPKQLFVAADGPRHDRLGEVEKCEEVKAIFNNIDWPCEIHTLFREQNLGCGKAVSSSIDWFFSFVEKGIILEDDCLPDQSFFSFSSQLLDYYENNDQVMHICGSNKQCGIKRGSYSYYFSKYPIVWGWATWKRAWEKYSFKLEESEEQLLSIIENRVHDKEEVDYLYGTIIDTEHGAIDTWDYQWVYTLLKYKGVSIVPQYNLIENIGFESDATHTTSSLYWYEYSTRRPINEIKINPNIVVNEKADIFYMSLIMWKFKKVMYRIYLYNRFKNILRKMFSLILH